MSFRHLQTSSDTFGLSSDTNLKLRAHTRVRGAAHELKPSPSESVLPFVHGLNTSVVHSCPDLCVQDGLVPNDNGPIHALDACKIEEPDSNPQRMDTNSAPPLSSLHITAQYIHIPTTRIIPNDDDSTMPEFSSIMGAKPVLAVRTGELFLGSDNQFTHWMVLHEKKHQYTPMIYRTMAKVLTYLTCFSALTIFLCPAEDYMEARFGVGSTNYRCHDGFNLP
ncbi:hypothetical protein BDR06DRAFT_1014000 [Suillus hirtellus]|nr:hypothetical protein BDR06DRAFT_1014000 [Suillus hirtellus]